MCSVHFTDQRTKLYLIKTVQIYFVGTKNLLLLPQEHFHIKKKLLKGVHGK